jgi:hypothetical protein
VPPVPQYGEYAPGGYVPPQPVAGPPQAAPTQPQPYGAQPYGAQPYGAQPYGAASYPPQAGPRRRKTWDLVLTIVLLSLGFFGMLIGLLYSALFADPAFMDEMARQSGLQGFNGDVGAAPAIVSVSHVLLYLLAVGGSLPLLIKKRVAFWVPLAAGVIAAVIFWGAFTAVILSDPAFVGTFS